jgi:hypothetical protein
MPSLSGFTRRPVARAVVLLAAALAEGACYDYVPLHSSQAPVAGSDVQLVLTDSGSVIEARTVGPASTAIEGTYVADSAGHYIISVKQVNRRDADPTEWRGEHLAVPQPLVANVTERKLSRTRTVLTSVGLVIGAFAARAAIKSFGGSNSGKSNGGTGQSPQ